MYVYIQSERCLWTVGFYDPSGKFIPESDYSSMIAAATRVAYLNGGYPESTRNFMQSIEDKAAYYGE